MNIISDIVNSCSHEKVAEAALSSIGGRYLENVRTAAQAAGLSVGVFTAQIVHDFFQAAEQEHLWRLSVAIAGQDQPILAGLKMILDARRVTNIGSSNMRLPRRFFSGADGGGDRRGFGARRSGQPYLRQLSS